MLILTRRIGKSLQIGPDVRITVLWHRGPQVALGICAPKAIAVHRQEVFDRIQQQRASAPATLHVSELRQPDGVCDIEIQPAQIRFRAD
jgi:carbon storage regulator